MLRRKSWSSQHAAAVGILQSSMQQEQQSTMLGARLDDRPAPPLAIFIGLQHVLAMIGGIATAPLLIALGLGLGPTDTAYLIASALTVSGAATLIQVSRLGGIGSGLLSVQGTSFTFIGPIVYAFDVANGPTTPNEALGSLFGACMLLAVAMIVISRFVDRLQRLITANVTGVTVLLLGGTLVLTTLQNLQRAATDGNAMTVIGLTVVVFVTVALLARSPSPLVRLCSVVAGFAVGLTIAGILGLIDTTGLASLPVFFLPEVARYPLSFELDVVLILAPIFLVSATESLGDLGATASLSGVRVGSRDYWSRLRGGVTADSINSFLAAVFSTFPNTTFSQNNGVIRLTGITSRHVGYYVAALLMLLGLVPVVAGIFQIMPEPVLYGGTLLMFIMVGYAGYRLITDAGPRGRDWFIVGAAIIGGLALGRFGPMLDGLPQTVINVLSFPVSSGAFLAMLLEMLVPHAREKSS